LNASSPRPLNHPQGRLRKLAPAEQREDVVGGSLAGFSVVDRLDFVSVEREVHLLPLLHLLRHLHREDPVDSVEVVEPVEEPRGHVVPHTLCAIPGQRLHTVSEDSVCLSDCLSDCLVCLSLSLSLNGHAAFSAMQSGAEIASAGTACAGLRERMLLWAIPGQCAYTACAKSAHRVGDFMPATDKPAL